MWKQTSWEAKIKIQKPILFLIGNVIVRTNKTHILFFISFIIYIKKEVDKEYEKIKEWDYELIRRKKKTGKKIRGILVTSYEYFRKTVLEFKLWVRHVFEERHGRHLTPAQN